MIAVHEAGHLLMAKWSNIRVDIFSIGMGKPICGFQYGETYYQIGRLPFGGFCAFGEENDKEDKDPRSLMNSPLWARLLTVLGGSLFNILFAAFLMILLFWHGFYEKQLSNEVVVPQKIMIDPDSDFIESPAWKAGLRSGDRIIQICNQKITHFSEIPAVLSFTRGIEKPVTFIRGDQTNTILLTTVLSKDTGMEVIGVYPIQSAVVSSVLANTPAEKAGLQEKDIIKEINGQPITFFYELNENVMQGKPLTLLVERSNQLLTVSVTPEKISNNFKVGVVGELPKQMNILKKAANLGQAITLSLDYVFSMIDKMISSMFKLFTGQVNLEKNLSGPVRIVSITGS
ncbi:MAG: RIP metalloprotease RseP, partial [Brevinema sp.]